jgi:hypothetical protein
MRMVIGIPHLAKTNKKKFCIIKCKIINEQVFCELTQSESQLVLWQKLIQMKIRYL